MYKFLPYLKVALITATAIFVAFHTVIFIQTIDPNPYLSWVLSLSIEGFLVILSMQRSWTAKLLLVPLFCISVVASSASFIIKNEDSLNKFLNLNTIRAAEIKMEESQKRIGQQRQEAVKQLKQDIAETQAQIQNLDGAYFTKSLQRERKLKDLLIGKMSEGEQLPARADMVDYLTAYQSIVFLFIILIVQAVIEKVGKALNSLS